MGNDGITATAHASLGLRSVPLSGLSLTTSSNLSPIQAGSTPVSAQTSSFPDRSLEATSLTRNQGPHASGYAHQDIAMLAEPHSLSPVPTSGKDPSYIPQTFKGGVPLTGGIDPDFPAFGLLNIQSSTGSPNTVIRRNTRSKKKIKRNKSDSSVAKDAGISSEDIFGKSGDDRSDAESSASNRFGTSKSRGEGRQKGFKGAAGTDVANSKGSKGLTSNLQLNLSDNLADTEESLANVLRGLRRNASSNPSTPNLSERSSSASRPTSSRLSPSDHSGVSIQTTSKPSRSRTNSVGAKSPRLVGSLFGKREKLSDREHEENQLRVLADLRLQALALISADDSADAEKDALGTAGEQRGSTELITRDLSNLPALPSTPSSSYSLASDNDRNDEKVKWQSLDKGVSSSSEKFAPYSSETGDHRALYGSHQTASSEESAYSGNLQESYKYQFPSPMYESTGTPNSDAEEDQKAGDDQAARLALSLASKRRSTLRPILGSQQLSKFKEAENSKASPPEQASSTTRSKVKKGSSGDQRPLLGVFGGRDVLRLGLDSGTEADIEADKDPLESETLERRRSTIRPGNIKIPLAYKAGTSQSSVL